MTETFKKKLMKLQELYPGERAHNGSGLTWSWTAVTPSGEILLIIGKSDEWRGAFSIRFGRVYDLHESGLERLMKGKKS